MGKSIFGHSSRVKINYCLRRQQRMEESRAQESKDKESSNTQGYNRQERSPGHINNICVAHPDSDAETQNSLQLPNRRSADPKDSGYSDIVRPSGDESSLPGTKPGYTLQHQQRVSSVAEDMEIQSIESLTPRPDT